MAGTRTFADKDLLEKALDEWVNGKDVEFILLGGGRHKVGKNHTGADYLAEKWAESRRFPRRIFHADWDRHGKAAGPLRNRGMLKEADALIVFWDGESPGTKDILQGAKKKGIPVKVVKF